MGTIDLAGLLAPTTPDSPAGEDLEYDPLFGEMERAAEGKPEQQFGDTIIPAEEPDWRLLKTKSEQLLTRSKDLRAAVYLTKAVLHTHGYQGLADGLSLIAGLVSKYWENLHPELDPEDDNDPIMRVNTLQNLCDLSGFMQPITLIPLVSSPLLGSANLRDLQSLEGTLTPIHGEGKELTLDQVNAAFKAASAEEVQTQLGDIRRGIDAVETIQQRLNEQVGADQAPDLQALATVLRQSEKEIVTRADVATPNVQADAAEEAGNPVAPQETGSTPSGAIRNRDDVVQALDRICAYYAQSEPNSPLPFLLRRAKRLVHKDFFEIVQDLAPDSSAQFDFLWKEDEAQ